MKNALEKPDVKSARDIIDLWPTVPDFARAMGVPTATARRWRERDRIPIAHWPLLMAEAAKAGYQINRSTLARFWRQAKPRKD